MHIFRSNSLGHPHPPKTIANICTVSQPIKAFWHFILQYIVNTPYWQKIIHICRFVFNCIIHNIENTDKSWLTTEPGLWVRFVLNQVISFLPWEYFAVRFWKFFVSSLWSMWTIMVVVVQRVCLIYKSHLCRQAVIAMLAALVMFDKLGTNGYYSELRVPFGFCQDKGWCQWTPGPGQLIASVLVPMVVGGAAAPLSSALPRVASAIERICIKLGTLRNGQWPITSIHKKTNILDPRTTGLGFFLSADVITQWQKAGTVPLRCQTRRGRKRGVGEEEGTDHPGH